MRKSIGHIFFFIAGILWGLMIYEWFMLNNLIEEICRELC